MNVCYTCITRGYDELKDPLVVSDGWQYVVFSDTHIDSDIWECVVVKESDRFMKIKGFVQMFQSLTLYVDGSIEIIGDLNQFVSEVHNWFTLWKHPHRNCTYKEAEAVIRLKGCNPQRTRDQVDKYRRAGFPKNWGLGANGVMLRDFSDKIVRDICSMWWHRYDKGIHRDQLSLMYCFWSNGYKPDLFNDDIFNKYFILGAHL